MTADWVDWQDEHALDHRRRLRTAMFVSIAVHAVVVGIFAASPPVPMADAPEYIAVELVAPAGPARSPSRAARTASAPAPKAPAPEPAAAPPPPIAKAPVQVLPEETPGRIREAKPPVEQAEAQPPPKPEPAPRRRRREKAVSYEDAMAALNDELGVDETAELLEPAVSGAEVGEAESSATGSQQGVTVSPEQLAWDARAVQKIEGLMVNLPRYRGRGLVVTLEIRVAASGDLSGEPRLIRTSGDLDFDRLAMSAVMLSSPLDPPLAAGPRQLNLRSERR